MYRSRTTWSCHVENIIDGVIPPVSSCWCEVWCSYQVSGSNTETEIKYEGTKIEEDTLSGQPFSGGTGLSEDRVVSADTLFVRFLGTTSSSGGIGCHDDTWPLWTYNSSNQRITHSQNLIQWLSAERENVGSRIRSSKVLKILHCWKSYSFFQQCRIFTSRKTIRPWQMYKDNIVNQRRWLYLSMTS